jgi:hypothetical protein
MLLTPDYLRVTIRPPLMFDEDPTRRTPSPAGKDLGRQGCVICLTSDLFA